MNKEEAEAKMFSELYFSDEEEKVIGLNFLHELYDDFESRDCEDCIHCLSTKEHALCTHEDNIQEIYNYNYMQVTLDFGCNKWERKENE
jgi:hypothetical protein